jgi:hypothetical protein
MMKEHEGKIRGRSKTTPSRLQCDDDANVDHLRKHLLPFTQFSFLPQLPLNINRSNVKTGFELIARGKLRMKDASNGIKTHDLRTSSGSDRRGPSSLPLFGHYCCRLAIEAPKFPEYSGFIRILDGLNVSQEGNVLRNAVLASHENEQTKEVEPNEVETRRRTSRKDHYDHQVVEEDGRGMRPRRSKTNMKKTFQERLCWASLKDFHLRLWILPPELKEELQREDQEKKTTFLSNNHENEEVEEDLMMKERRRDRKEEQDSKDRMKLPSQDSLISSTRRDRRVMMTVGESSFPSDSLEPQEDKKDDEGNPMKRRCCWCSSPSSFELSCPPPSHHVSNAASHSRLCSFIQGILHFPPDTVMAINKNSTLTPMNRSNQSEDSPDNSFLFSSSDVTSTLVHGNNKTENESSVGKRTNNRRRSSRTSQRENDEEQTCLVMSSFFPPSSSFRSSSSNHWMTQIEERMQDYLNWESVVSLESPMEILIPSSASSYTSVTSGSSFPMTSPSIECKAISSPSKLRSRYRLFDDDDHFTLTSHSRSTFNTSSSHSSPSSCSSSSSLQTHRLLRPQGTTIGSLYDQTPSS